MNFENCNVDFKNSSSKIYPILNRMEDNGLIRGEWDVNENNKRVKYYTLTENGLFLINQIRSNMIAVFTNPTWMEFFKDMTDLEIRL